MWNSGGDLREWPRSRLTRANVSYIFATRKFRRTAEKGEKNGVKGRQMVDVAIETTSSVALFNCAILRRKWVTLAKLMSFAKFPQLRHRARHSARWSFLVIEKFFAPRENYEFFKYFSYTLLKSVKKVWRKAFRLFIQKIIKILYG